MKKIIFFETLIILVFLTSCGPSSDIKNALNQTEEKNNNSTDFTNYDERKNAESEAENTETKENGEDKSEETVVLEEKFNSCNNDLNSEKEKIKKLEEILISLKEKKPYRDFNINGIFVEYFKKVEQRKYPFDLCGFVPNFKNEVWYPSFEETLRSKGVYFSLEKRNLETKDFFGGCESNVGKVAFFLGSESKGNAEFHLLRYEFDSNQIKEAILGKGTCEDCPNRFGKRVGSYVELIGKKNTKYRYYFDKNVVLEESDFN